jgi:hypothetical protein
MRLFRVALLVFVVFMASIFLFIVGAGPVMIALTGGGVPSVPAPSVPEPGTITVGDFNLEGWLNYHFIAIGLTALGLITLTTTVSAISSWRSARISSALLAEIRHNQETRQQ